MWSLRLLQEPSYSFQAPFLSHVLDISLTQYGAQQLLISENNEIKLQVPFVKRDVNPDDYYVLYERS